MIMKKAFITLEMAKYVNNISISCIIQNIYYLYLNPYYFTNNMKALFSCFTYCINRVVLPHEILGDIDKHQCLMYSLGRGEEENNATRRKIRGEAA